MSDGVRGRVGGMAPDTTKLTRKQVAAEQLADWEWLVGAIEARYETGGFATGLELVNRIGAAAEEADHHPDLTLTWPARPRPPGQPRRRRRHQP